MTHFSQQDNFSVAARVLGALFYYAPESAEAAPLVAVLTNDGWETQWPLPEASLAPLVTAFQTQCEETHAQAWQRLFVGPWADNFGSLLLMAAWLAENGRQTECEELLAWHLFPWSTRFLDVFIEKAEHPFYRALGELARLTLAQWQSQLLIPVAVKPLFR